MKKLIFCTALLIFLATNINVSWSKAETNETYFAKVANEGVFFYSLPIKSDSCKMFEIPASYFVLLTGKENEFFYRAKYSDVEGFVPISSVEPIEETPNYPFAMSSFRVFLASDLYSQPNQKSSLISTIEPLTISSTYYGKISGEEVLPSSTNVWYYASFFDGTKTVRGYMFSYYCDHFQEIQKNNETYTPITREIFKEQEQVFSSPEKLSSTTKALIAVGVSLPCLAIILLLLKRKHPSQNKQKKVLRKPRRDYYEFNEDDI